MSLPNSRSLSNRIDDKANTIHGHTKLEIEDMPTKLSEFENDLGMGPQQDDLKEARYSTPVETTASVISLSSGVMTGKPNVVVKVNPYTNLLGDIGDFEIDSNKDGIADGWSATAGLSPYLNWVHNIYGQYSQEVSLNGTGTRYIECAFPVIANKYYFASMNGELSQGDGTVLQILNPGGLPLEGVRFSTGKARKGVKVQPTSSGNSIFRVNIEGTSGYGWLDGAMVIEITAEEYSTLSVEQLIQKYPYINGSAAKPISNIRIKSVGKNLFDKSKATRGTANEDGSFSKDSLSLYGYSDYIRVSKGKKYTKTYAYGCSFFDLSKRFVSLLTYTKDVTPPDEGYIVFNFLWSGIDKTQLESGAVETAYEPYVSTEAYFNMPLRRLNNVAHDEIRNSVQVDDKLLGLGRWEKVQRINEDVLSGNKGWSTVVPNIHTYYASVDIAGIASDSALIATSSDGNYVNENADKRAVWMIGTTLFVMIEKAKIDAQSGGSLLEKWRAYLNTYPITLTYKLANEVTTTLNGVGELIAQAGGSIIIEADGALPTITYNYPTNLTGQVQSSIEMIKSISRELTPQPEYSMPVETISSIIPVDNNASKGRVGVIIKGNTAANMVKNGNFANGTTGWAANLATIGVSNNVLSITGTGTDRYPYAYNTVGAKIIGRKYYIRAGVRVTNSNCTDILVDYSEDRVVITKPTANNWYNVSAVLTATNTSPHLYFQHYYADAATASGKVMQVRDVMVIDLTLLGLSSLTIEQCEQRFPNWFDGIKSADNITVVSQKDLGFPVATNGYFAPAGGFYYVGRLTTDLIIGNRYKITSKLQHTTSFKMSVAVDNDSNNAAVTAFDTAVGLKSYEFIYTQAMRDANMILRVFVWGVTTFSFDMNDIILSSAIGESYINESLRSTPNMAYDELKNAILVDGKLMSLGYWEKTQRVGTVTLNGSEGWAIDSAWSSTNNMCFSAKTGAKNTAVATVNHINDRFTPLLRADMTKDVEGLYMSDWEVGTVEIKIARTKLSAQTVEGFKAWLASNPVTLLYQLSTPVISKITNISDIVVEPGRSVMIETDGVLPVITYSYPVNLVAKIDSSIEMIKSLSNSKANRVQENWIEPTLVNGWVSIGGFEDAPGYFKDEFGIVHLRGAIKSGSTTQWSTILTLPHGYRPPYNCAYAVHSNLAYGVVMITRDGVMQFIAGSNTSLSLSGISYKV